MSVLDSDLQFIVEIDASEVRVGVVLSLLSPHRAMVHLCTYFSHHLSLAEQNYDVGNQELLTVRQVLDEW